MIRYRSPKIEIGTRDKKDMPGETGTRPARLEGKRYRRRRVIADPDLTLDRRGEKLYPKSITLKEGSDHDDTSLEGN
jgi:hypothetical protein